MIDTKLLISIMLLVACLMQLYPLRSMSMAECFNSYGIGMAFATFSYKLFSIIVLVIFVLYIKHGQGLMLFGHFLLGGIASVIFLRLLVKIGIISNDLKENPPFVLSLAGLVLFIIQVNLINTAWHLN